MKDRFHLILALAFLAVVALIGGASRADALSQTPLRLVSLGFIVAGLWAPNRVRLKRYRPLFWFLALTALLPALQLVPLPYDVWAAIPGRGFYAAIVDAIGLPHTWRPLSLVPDITWNALLSLLVPLAMLILAAQVPADRLSRLALAVLALALVSMVLGHAQAAGGVRSALRFYRITNSDAMVGLFANRNHHAVLLAIALPILCALPIGFRQNETWRRVGLPVSALGGLTIGATLLLAGSRAGLLTGAVGALAGTVLYASMASARLGQTRRHHRDRSRWLERLRHPIVVPLAAVLLIAVAAVGFASTPTMQRLIKTNAAEEDRFQLLGPMMELGQSMFPFGGGFGSFNVLFRRFEEVENLKTVYLNHAHMDVVQIVIEGGILAALLFAAFLVWWARRAFIAWRQPASALMSDNLARLGSITTGLAMLASLVDYPLRTPIHMAIFVIGCVWLQRGGRERTESAA